MVNTKEKAKELVLIEKQKLKAILKSFNALQIQIIQLESLLKERSAKK